jgi:hypothetical protein
MLRVRKYKPSRQTHPRRLNMRGGAWWDNIVSGVKNVLGELKKNKAISKLGTAYGSTGLPMSEMIGKIGKFAEQQGYGKRRPRRVGAGLKLAGAGPRKKTMPHRLKMLNRVFHTGAGLNLAGMGRKRKVGRPKGKKTVKKVIIYHTTAPKPRRKRMTGGSSVGFYGGKAPFGVAGTQKFIFP